MIGVLQTVDVPRLYRTSRVPLHDLTREAMLSTLLSADVPPGDAELMWRLNDELAQLKSDETDSLFRFAVANEAGELYRMVLVFGFYKSKRALELMQELGYQNSGPHAGRQLDAVFLSTQQAHVE